MAGINLIKNQIRTSPSLAQSLSHLTFRRASHALTYARNADDDQTPPSILPNGVIHPQSDKCWVPHPHTGVFGPGTDHHHHHISASTGSKDAEESVLEEKVFFRPTSIQDLQKH